MVRARDAPRDRLAFIPLRRLAMAPIWAQLDQRLEDAMRLQRVTAALRRRAPQTAPRGRPSTPVEVLLRMLGVTRLEHWSDAETEQFVADRLVLRQCCRGSRAPGPDATTLRRGAPLLDPTTLAALNDRVIALARALNVPRGRQLRVDSTVVETTRQHPTARGLLGEGVRGLHRLWRRATAVVGQGPGVGPQACRSRRRSGRRGRQPLQRLARHQGAAAPEQLQQAYERLLTVVRKPPAPAGSVGPSLRAQTVPSARRLVRPVEQLLPHGERGLNQTVRRVLQGEVVPAQAKLVRRVEPHPQSSSRRQTGKAVEVGRQGWLEAVAGALSSGARRLAQAGQAFPELPDRLGAHRQRFGRPPWRLAADRGG
jgi:transposase, IS5 family